MSPAPCGSRPEAAYALKGRILLGEVDGAAVKDGCLALFLGGGPPAPHGECGPDPEGVDLDCRESACP